MIIKAVALTASAYSPPLRSILARVVASGFMAGHTQPRFGRSTRSPLVNTQGLPHTLKILTSKELIPSVQGSETIRSYTANPRYETGLQDPTFPKSPFESPILDTISGVTVAFTSPPSRQLTTTLEN